MNPEEIDKNELYKIPELDWESDPLDEYYKRNTPNFGLEYGFNIDPKQQKAAYTDYVSNEANLSHSEYTSCLNKSIIKNKKNVLSYMVSPRQKYNKENDPTSKIPKLTNLSR